MGLISRLFGDDDDFDTVESGDSDILARLKAEDERASKLISELKAWRPVGTTVSYLGRQCFVVSHKYRQIVGYFSYIRPALNVQYADDAGQIHDLMLTEDQAVTIMKSQP